MDKLDAMRTFVMVVQEGGFSKAAERLGLSPQRVSKYISGLEELIKTRLLNRTTRRISLTEAGRTYYERCQQILIDIDEMENTMSNLHSHVTGHLSITAPVSFGMKHLPKLLVEFQQYYPDVQMDISLSDKKIDIVEEGVDIALRIGKLTSSSLICRKLADIRICICASPLYLAKYGTPASLQELAHHRYLKYTYADPIDLITPSKQIRIETFLTSYLSSNNGDLLVNAAIEGDGIIIQPTFISGDALASGKLVRILHDYEPEPLGLYVMYANRKFLASKVRSFVDFASNYYGTIPYWDEKINTVSND